MAEAVELGRINAAETDRMRQAAEVLLEARRECKPIENLDPALRPRSMEEAYALQDVMAELLGPIGGWKIGAPSPVATPLFAPMPLLGGFVPTGERLGQTYSRLRGIEAEIAFLIGKDLPVRQAPYTREEVIASIESAHAAIEILESAFINPDKADHLSMVGDLQINGGFCYGYPVENWQRIDIANETVEVVADSIVRHEGGMGNSAGADLLRLVTWLANEGQSRTGGLRKGQWVTTGSWSGKLYGHPRSSIQATFGHFGTVSLAFE